MLIKRKLEHSRSNSLTHSREMRWNAGQATFQVDCMDQRIGHSIASAIARVCDRENIAVSRTGRNASSRTASQRSRGHPPGVDAACFESSSQSRRQSAT